MKNQIKSMISIVGLSLFAITTANAAVSNAFTGSTGNSSLVFSAWDDASATGYSIDLGVRLNDIIGNDSILSGSAGTANNTMLATGVTYGSTLSIALTDWNLSSALATGVFNIAAVDTSGRARALVTNSDSTWVGGTNSEIAGIGGSFNSYVGLGAAATTAHGTTSIYSGLSPDAFYPATSTWGDDLGGFAGFAGSSIALNGVGNLFVAYQKSISSSNSDLLGGSSLLQTSGGNPFTAYLSNVGGVEYLNIAAVPEVDTSGMMIAGLGLMGFIARRRNANKA